VTLIASGVVSTSGRRITFLNLTPDFWISANVRGGAVIFPVCVGLEVTEQEVAMATSANSNTGFFNMARKLPPGCRGFKVIY